MEVIWVVDEGSMEPAGARFVGHRFVWQQTESMTHAESHRCICHAVAGLSRKDSEECGTMRNSVGGQQRLAERNRPRVQLLLQSLFDLNSGVMLQLFRLQEWKFVVRSNM